MRDASATRGRLLAAAMAVFAETGYAGATTRAIAERAGVNEVTLFRHFGSKADLMTEALASQLGKLTPQFAAPSGDIEQDLVRVVTAYQEIVGSHARFIISVLSDVPRFPELKAVADVPRAMIAAAAGMIARYQQQGLLQDEAAPVVAASLLTPLLFLASVRQAAPDLIGSGIDPVQHVRRFLHGRLVAPRPPVAARRRAAQSAQSSR